jgi:hypothetical protein
MKFIALAAIALLGVSAVTLEQKSAALINEPCEPALDVSEKQLYIELDYFSRSFDIKHYNNAVKIYNELKGDGLNPRMFVTSWELYDRSFSFPRVRRYDLVQQHMDLLQHFEDNLNQNFMNSQHLANFIKVGKAAQKALNEKYHDGEFSDPALYDPEADHPTTWSNVKI